MTWPAPSSVHEEGRQLPPLFFRAGTTQPHVGFDAQAEGSCAHDRKSCVPPSKTMPGGVSVHIWPATQVCLPQAKGPPASAQPAQIHFCVALSHVGEPQKQLGIGSVQMSQVGVGVGQLHLPPMHRARGPNGQSHGHRSPRVPSTHRPPELPELPLVPLEPPELLVLPLDAPLELAPLLELPELLDPELDAPEEELLEPDAPDVPEDEPRSGAIEPPHAMRNAPTRPKASADRVFTD